MFYIFGQRAWNWKLYPFYTCSFLNDNNAFSHNELISNNMETSLLVCSKFLDIRWYTTTTWASLKGVWGVTPIPLNSSDSTFVYLFLALSAIWNSYKPVSIIIVVISSCITCGQIRSIWRSPPGFLKMVRFRTPAGSFIPKI